MTMARAGESSDCGKCGKVVKESQHGLMCDLCSIWLQCACLKMFVEEYKTMQRPNSKLQFYCPDCRSSLSVLSDRNKELKLRSEELMKENETLREEMRGMNKKMEDLREYVKKEGHRIKVEDLYHRELIESVKENMMEEMKEEQDQRVRKNNLVLYNVKESGNSDSADRQRLDKNVCEETFMRI